MPIWIRPIFKISNINFLEYNIDEVADRIENMLNYLKMVNKVFIDAKLDYSDIFEKLKAAGVTLTDDETKPVSASKGKDWF